MNRRFRSLPLILLATLYAAGVLVVAMVTIQKLQFLAMR